MALSAILAALAPMAIDMGMKFFSKKGGGEGQGRQLNLQPMMEPWQMSGMQDYMKWLTKALGSYTPGQQYGGQFAAPMSGMEKTGMSEIEKLMGGPTTGPMFGLAEEELRKTLTGKYDPATSPFYKAFRAATKREGEEAIDVSRATRGARGTFFHTKGIEEEGDITSRALESLNLMLGQMAETERGKRFEAAPRAAELDKYKHLTAPMMRAGAAFEAGKLPRMIAQTDLEGKYKEFVRSRGELTDIPRQTGALATTGLPYGVKQWEGPPQASSFGRIMDVMGGNIGPIKDILELLMKRGGGGGTGGGIGGLRSIGQMIR